MSKVRAIYCLVAYATVITIMFTHYCDHQKLSGVFFSSRDNYRVTKTCGRYPTEDRILSDNVHWQVLEFSGGFIRILNAYLDLRQNKSVVRLNVNSKVLESSTIFHCQFWYNEDDPPVIVETTKVLLMWSELKGDKRLLVRFTKASFISAFGADDPSVLYPYLVECPFDGPVPTRQKLL
jgi:hypothetical protein